MKHFKARTKFFFRTICVCVIFSFGPFPAGAQDVSSQKVKKMTNASVSAFLHKSHDLSLSPSYQTTDQNLRTYYIRHISPSGRYHSITEYDIPGFPAKEREMTLDRDEFIAHVIKGRSLMENYQAKLSVENIDIARGGKKATVLTRTKENGTMHFPHQGTQEAMPVTGESRCTQHLVLSKEKYIQVFRADCRTDIRFSPFEENDQWGYGWDSDW